MTKKSILSLSLLFALTPLTMHSIDERLSNEKHIKELEDIKHKKEFEAAKISSRILKERKMAVEREQVLLREYWKPEDKDNKEVSFNEFLFDLYDAFDAGDDTKPILDKAPLNREGCCNAERLVLRLLIQEIVIGRMSDRFIEAMQELAVINKKLRTLKQ